jgi:hypothetical protein
MRAMLSRLTPHLLALGVVVLGLSTAACKKPEYPKCKKDKHCNVDLDEKCVEGMCQNCKVDGDCNGQGPERGQLEVRRVPLPGPGAGRRGRRR